MKTHSQSCSTYPIFLFLLSLLSCSAFAEDLFRRFEPVSYTQYQQVLPDQTIGGYPILTLGNHLLIAQLKGFQAGGGEVPLPLGFAALIDLRENKFFASVLAEANLAESGRAIDWRDEPCKGDDFLWKRSTGGSFTNINCVTISTRTQFLPDYPTVLSVRFTRYGGSARRLSYNVNVNPEFFHVARDAEPDLKANGWHKSRYENDPEKVKFFAGLVKWATVVQDRMDKAFNKDLEAFSDMSSFGSFFSE